MLLKTTMLILGVLNQWKAPQTNIHGSPYPSCETVERYVSSFYHPHLWSTKSRTQWTAAKILAHWVSRICWSSFFTWNHGKYGRFTFWKTCRSTKDDKLADWCSTIALLHLQISSENETFNLLATGNIMLPWLAHCQDQPLVRVAPKRYLASLAARWFPPGTRVSGGNQIDRIFRVFLSFELLHLLQYLLFSET